MLKEFRMSDTRFCLHGIVVRDFFPLLFSRGKSNAVPLSFPPPLPSWVLTGSAAYWGRSARPTPFRETSRMWLTRNLSKVRDRSFPSRDGDFFSSPRDFLHEESGHLPCAFPELGRQRVVFLCHRQTDWPHPSLPPTFFRSGGLSLILLLSSFFSRRFSYNPPATY